jgi:hypothetical protein
MDIQFPSPNCLPHHTTITSTPIKGITMAQNNKICAISTTSFYHIVSNANNYYGKVEQFMQSLYKINTALTNDNNKNLHIRTIILPKYYDYIKIFEKAHADKFPPHYPNDHTILLPEGFQPPSSPLYSSSYHS